MLEYLVNYALVGLLWSCFLRLRYGADSQRITKANWAIITMFWPIMALVFLQGCLFGQRSSRRAKPASGTVKRRRHNYR